jgi:hypothetical protein
VEDEMDALARRDQRGRVRLRKPPHGIGEGPGGVDHDARARSPAPSALLILRDDAIDETVVGFRHLDDARVVEDRRALIGRCLHQVDQQPRVVELPVVVHDAAAEPLGLDRRQPRERLLAREDLGGAESVLAATRCRP